MATKTITITTDAYEKLATRKAPGESFSDVINKTFGGSSLLDLVGVLSDKEVVEFRNNVSANRKQVRIHLDRTARML